MTIVDIVWSSSPDVIRKGDGLAFYNYVCVKVVAGLGVISCIFVIANQCQPLYM